MHTTTVEVGDTRGAIFEGELPGTYCFVPENCIREEHGKTKIDGTGYIRSHWDERNMRVSAESGGKRLFPNLDRPVDNLQAEPVRHFLHRIREVWSDLAADPLLFAGWRSAGHAYQSDF